MLTRYEDGYKKLVVWKNAAELRKLVYDLTADFPKSEMRRVSQMRDAARSVKQNIQEGRKRRSEREFLQALNISRGSLAELKGDIEDSHEDELIPEDFFKKLIELVCKTDFLLHRLMKSILDDINSTSATPKKQPIKPFKLMEPI